MSSTNKYKVVHHPIILATISVLLFIFLNNVNHVSGYDLATQPEKSLYAIPSYPYYVRNIFRFYGYSTTQITLVEKLAIEQTIATIANVRNVSGSTDVIEISSVSEFNPEGGRGGIGVSTTIETKVYVATLNNAQVFKLKINKMRDDRTEIETLFKDSVKAIATSNSTNLIPDGFYIFMQYSAEIHANQPINRNYWQLLISCIVATIIGSMVVTTQAMRRYDFDPLNEPTQTVDTGKYEYVVDDGEEKKG